MRILNAFPVVVSTTTATKIEPIFTAFAKTLVYCPIVVELTPTANPSIISRAVNAFPISEEIHLSNASRFRTITADRTRPVLSEISVRTTGVSRAVVMMPTVVSKNRVLTRTARIHTTYSAPVVKMPFSSLSITTASAHVFQTSPEIRKYFANEYYRNPSAHLIQRM